MEALADSPAVLIQGPRQCGKTTLARTVGESEGYHYLTHHFRDRYGLEVDIVIQRSPLATAGVEVKASGTVVNADFKGLRKLQDALGEKFAGGALLYTGDRVMPFGDKLHAVPLGFLWM